MARCAVEARMAAEGIGYRQMHVGQAELSLDGAIDKLYHRVHNRLRMNDGLDATGLDTKKIVGLDDFEGLVHHRGRIDGYFPAHVPVGVLEGVGGSGFCHTVGRPSAEGASRGRD